jgi:hypothetical protein
MDRSAQRGLEDDGSSIGPHAQARSGFDGFDARQRAVGSSLEGDAVEADRPELPGTPQAPDLVRAIVDHAATDGPRPPRGAASRMA